MRQPAKNKGSRSSSSPLSSPEVIILEDDDDDAVAPLPNLQAGGASPQRKEATPSARLGLGSHRRGIVAAVHAAAATADTSSELSQGSEFECSSQASSLAPSQGPASQTSSVVPLDSTELVTSSPLEASTPLPPATDADATTAASSSSSPEIIGYSVAVDSADTSGAAGGAANADNPDDNNDDDDGEDEDDVIYTGSKTSRARIMLKCAEILPHTTNKFILKAMDDVLNTADVTLRRRESFYVARVIDALENESGEAEVIFFFFCCLL